MQNQIFKSLEGKSFSFDCHPGVPCFKECCAKLRLVLTPYDVLRIKTRLGITSGAFLDSYTDVIFEEANRFPLLKLTMLEAGACPFLKERGCEIYEDRPAACRLYPLGRASSSVGEGNRGREQYFMVAEAHCLGFREKREWSVEEWLSGEGLHEYDTMNAPWLEIVTCGKSLGPEEHIEKKLQVFFMASYHLDRFRSFLFNSRFFDLFDIETDLRSAMASNDLKLMLFSFDWLKYTLFGDDTIKKK
jgi:uncharacterized protein